MVAAQHHSCFIEFFLASPRHLLALGSIIVNPAKAGNPTQAV